MRTKRNIAVVAAGGTGSRIGSDMPKQYLELNGKPVIYYCLNLFENCDLIDEVVLVVSEDYLSYASHSIVDKFGFRKIRKITTGGETRQESVYSGLSSCPKGIDLVIIHDSARPFLAMDLLKKTIIEAERSGAAILAVPAKESIKISNGKVIEKSLWRDSVWIAQTPQVFRFDEILKAHESAASAENEATDDSQLYEQYCGSVSVVRGSYNNMKITNPMDYIAAKELAKELF